MSRMSSFVMVSRSGLVVILLVVLLLLLVRGPEAKADTIRDKSMGLRKFDCGGVVISRNFATVSSRYEDSTGVAVVHYRPYDAGLRPYQERDMKSFPLEWLDWDGTTGLWYGQLPRFEGSFILVMALVGEGSKKQLYAWSPAVGVVDWVDLNCAPKRFNEQP